MLYIVATTCINCTMNILRCALRSAHIPDITFLKITFEWLKIFSPIRRH